MSCVCSKNCHSFLKSSKAPYLYLSASEQRLIKGHWCPDRFFIRKFNVGKPAETEHYQNERPDLISSYSMPQICREYMHNSYNKEIQISMYKHTATDRSFEVTLCTRPINLAKNMPHHLWEIKHSWLKYLNIDQIENFAQADSLKHFSASTPIVFAARLSKQNVGHV